MKKKFFFVIVMGVMICMAACGEKGPSEEIGIPYAVLSETDDEGASEIAAEEKEKKIWYVFENIGFRMEIPESAHRVLQAETEPGTIFVMACDSFEVRLRRWEQVSRPSIEALAALVGKETKMPVETLQGNGCELVRVNWVHGDVNYFLLGKDGDAYELWIIPHVMKDPEVYGKVRGMEESFCQTQEISAGQEVLQVEGIQKAEIDYLVLVDKKHPLPEGWEEKLDLVYTVNSVGDRVPVERTAYKAYLELQEDLLQSEGIDIDLDSAYRSVEYQQEILERFTEKYGEAYARRTVATPGSSEHHTGLALDLYFRLDGTEVYENEDLVKYPEIWKKIHAKLAEHGFILRYPGWKNGEVDYTYEPWHIRYVGTEYAAEIMSKEEFSFEDWLEEKGYMN